MKRIFLVAIAFVLCLSLSIPCFAAEFRNPPIVDNAGLLTADELEELSSRLENIRDEYGIDVAVYTEDTMSGYDAEASADDIYDHNGYGAGSDGSGILLYICSGERKYHLSTYAGAIRLFHDSMLEYMEASFVPELSRDNWYFAVEEFVNITEEILWEYEYGTFSVEYADETESGENPLVVIGAALILTLLAAFFMMNGKLKRMKTAVGNDYASEYMKQGSRNITASRDIFLYSNIIRTAKPKNNTSPTHRSSSGRTHGGRGGSF